MGSKKKLSSKRKRAEDKRHTARRRLHHLVTKQNYKCHWCGNTIIALKRVNKHDFAALETLRTPDWQTIEGWECNWHSITFLLKSQDETTIKVVLRLASVDHVIPLCNGGTNEINNLVASCVMCNHEKADKSGDALLCESVSCPFGYGAEYYVDPDLGQL